MLKKFAFWSTLALAVILAVTAGAAFADTQTRVVKVSTDAYPGASYLDVVRGDDGALNGMVYFGSDGKVIRLSLAQLRTGPQLLKEMDGHPVIYLGLEDDFSETRGGHVTVRFLYSGISGEYKNFRIAIDFQGSAIVLRSDPNPRDPESDGNPYTSVFNHLFMEKATFWGKTIGIERVIPRQERPTWCYPFYFFGWEL